MAQNTNSYGGLDLEAAFEAVKGQLFGPLDPALVKLKFREAAEIAKEKRDQEMDPRAGRSLARGDPAERDRKDREEQIKTLTWLLANNALYRAAHEQAMASFDTAGRAIARAIEAGERAAEKLRREREDYLASTPRLRDGRSVFIDADGTCRDQNGHLISTEDAAEVEGQPKRAFRPYAAMTERAEEIDRHLAELRGWDVEVGGMRNEATDEKSPASRERLDDMSEHADQIAKDAETIQHDFETALPLYHATQDKVDDKPSVVATMAVPRI